jgi:hypothetical protein
MSDTYKSNRKEPTKKDWQKWYAHKSNREIEIEKESKE